MIKLLQILLIVFSISLYADCSSYTFLGSKQKSFDQNITTNNTIAWDYDDNHWSASQPLKGISPQKYHCQKRGYFLINNNEISYKTPTYMKRYYELKKGWNYVASPKDGLDVVKTFSTQKNITFVYVYDKVTKAWAGYSPDKNIENSIYNTRIILLKTIEPGLGFYIFAKKDLHIQIHPNSINSTCRKLLKDKRFEFLIDSGLDKGMVYNKERTIGFRSRYIAHYKKGIYDDTRVMLIYPKIDAKSKRSFKYGPALPKTQIEFPQEYEGIIFFMYDYKKQKCYQGIFPSIKVPPFASLKELK